MEAEQESGSSRSKRVWTAYEDALLVDCLVELKVEGKYNADNGFKEGYFGKLEEMLEEKSPGCGLKVTHIQNRLRTMKKAWQIVHDMLYGSNTSGFGWDPNKQVVTAPNSFCEDYIKVKKEAGNFRNKHLPHFDKMTFIWGKDRATGRSAQLPTEVVEEVNEELTAEHGRDEITVEEMENIVGESELAPEIQSVTRKRRRNSCDAAEVLADAMNNAFDKLEHGLLKVAETMCSSFAAMRQDNTKINSAQELYKELLKVDGLTVAVMNKAHVVLLRDENLMFGFPNVPNDLKAG